MREVWPGRRLEQITERGRELFRFVHFLGCLHLYPAQLLRQRCRAVKVAALAFEVVLEGATRIAVAPVFQHPGDQFLDRLCGFHLGQVLFCPGQHQTGFEFEQRSDQDQELGGHLEFHFAVVLELLHITDDDLPQFDFEQADLLSQHDAEEQVERPDENIEVQIKVQVQPGSHQEKRRGAIGRSRPEKALFAGNADAHCLADVG